MVSQYVGVEMRPDPETNGAACTKVGYGRQGTHILKYIPTIRYGIMRLAISFSSAVDHALQSGFGMIVVPGLSNIKRVVIKANHMGTVSKPSKRSMF